MPVDPATPLALNGDARQAGKLADLERRLAVLERQSLNKVIANTGTWQNAILVNGFTAGGTGRAPVSYYVDGLNRVELRGSAYIPAGDTGVRPKTIFTLAAGFRPLYRHRFAVISEYAGGLSECVVDVDPSGDVSLTLGGYSAQELPLDVIHFRTV